MLAIHTPTRNKITTKLVAIFLDSTGKKHQWTYTDVDPSLSAAKLRTYCEQIAQLDLFEKEGVLLFTKLVQAKLVTTIETPIFDLTDNSDQTFTDNEPPTRSLATADRLINTAPLKNTIEKYFAPLRFWRAKKLKNKPRDYGFT